ncbi:MAG: hypothetical protein M1839_002256 [Geoglossum umbratile]|nr:MAG: hypothetical protein M1839_002256 [Geoglossum umbratile]
MAARMTTITPEEETRYPGLSQPAEQGQGLLIGAIRGTRVNLAATAITIALVLAVKKHIDKHLKPHRCRNPECKDSAFASAGGALRHEREAHGMHAPKTYPCPFEMCDRGKNKPFHRNWNLGDHLRRVHEIQPDQRSQRGLHSQRSQQDRHDQHLSADAVFLAGGPGSAREYALDDDTGYNPMLRRVRGEEDEEDETQQFQGNPRQSRESWGTGYLSIEGSLLTPAPTTQGSPVEGPPTSALTELNSRWVTLGQHYQRMLDSPRDPTILLPFQLACYRMYKTARRIAGNLDEEEEGSFDSG